MSKYNQEAVEDGARLIITGIGLSLDDPGLRDTPARLGRAWRELTQGYWADLGSLFQVRFSAERYDQMIVLTDISFTSICEHHLLSFSGRAHVGYLPSNGNVIGLSKLARLVEVFARRLQIQERMTEQILSALVQHLKPQGAGVVVQAEHQCMSCRGVRKSGSTMITSALAGAFRDGQIKNEFLEFIR